MFCGNCGTQLADDAKFCANCGNVVSNENVGAVNAEQPVVEQPVMEQPVMEQPVMEQPVMEQPVMEQPSYEQPYYAQQGMEQEVPTQPKSKKPLIIAIAIAAACVIIAVVIWVVISFTGKANLKKQFLRDWERVESSDGTYYTLELDFSEDEIKYNFISTYFDETLATFDYEIISGNKFKLVGKSKEYTVEFNDDKTMMIFTPALTSTDAREYWYNF